MYAVFRQKVSNDKGPYKTSGPLKFVEGWFYWKFSAKNAADKMDFEDRLVDGNLQERSRYLYFVIDQCKPYRDPIILM